ncbi:hypothetical protein [Streptomyces spororaveus]|uniref:Uncharacterized protein n=1 Tax=Streptomyces spororaveus TaxID=284039 RepID=A0ABQ3T3F1_9ACTN|nr:hypothetical protein [Streptomyces spororaveus]GHI74550.1 hypothetical protein Sspor_01110 [Streptomyces spororaveus]
MKPQTPKTEFWTGILHGSHNSLPAKITATRDDTRPEPYAWRCTCGESRSFPTNDDVFDTAWQHTHPRPLDGLRQRAARQRRTRHTR